MNKEANCKICNKQLSGKQTLYCSIKCKNLAHQSYPAQKKRGLTRKLSFIKKYGSKCFYCGYSKNLAALAFHHKDDKAFKLDVRSLSNRKLEAIDKEMSKCILVCHNCHSEIHNPNLDLAKLLI